MNRLKTTDIAKKAVAWPITWSLFWLGHLCSKGAFTCKQDVDNYDHPHTHVVDIGNRVLYKLYQMLMGGSIIVQDWGGLQKPWEHVDEYSEELD